MQSVKVMKLVADLQDGVGSVANSLTVDQVNTMGESENLLFQLVALAVKAHDGADLTEEQTDDLEKAISALASLDEQYGDKEMDLVVNAMTKGAAKLKAAKAADRGTLAMNLEAQKATALEDLRTTFNDRRVEHEMTVSELSNIKGLASVLAVKTFLKWKDTNADPTNTRPPTAGNAWLTVDILTTNALAGCGFLDTDGTFYFQPIGKDYGKYGPRDLERDVWNKIGILDTEKIASATDVQGVTYRAIYRMSERSDSIDLHAYLAGLVDNGNLDTSRIGGSRGVYHVVEKEQDPGFVRQVLQSEFTEKYGKLPAEEKTA